MNSKPNPGHESLRKRRDFLALRAGKRHHSQSFVLQMRERSEIEATSAKTRVGYTVTKKVGNAVVRNRIKRRMRAVVCKAMLTNARSGHDYVLIGKPAALNTNFETMVLELSTSINQVHGSSKKSGRTNGK